MKYTTKYPYLPPSYSVRLVRDSRAKQSPEPIPAHPAIVASIFKTRLLGLPHEEMWLLMVSVKAEVTGMVKVSQGGIAGCVCTSADILRPAVVHNARGIILTHNHPSGDPEPSPEDRSFTRELRQACDAVGIPLLDHFVIAEDKHESFFARGWL